MAIINQWPMSETKVLGGGGPGMYSVVLPRSVYWASASEWIQVNSQQPESGNANTRQQCFCNGNLWVVGKGNINAIDIITGEVVDSITYDRFGMSGYLYGPGPIATDGNRYILIGKAQGNTTLNSLVREIWIVDVIEKTVGNVNGITGSVSADYNTKYSAMGPIVYSEKYKSFFVFGAGFSISQYFSSISYKIDMTENKTTEIAGCPNNVLMGYAYSDEVTGDIYIGSGVDGYVLRYSPENNTYTTIRSGLSLPSSDVASRAWVTIGDTLYCITTEGIIPFDPTTGNTMEGPTPANPGFGVATGFGAASGNTIYISADQGLYKCVLYENIPEEAPIVAKIYKGQKYHTLQPFTIHGEGGDVNVTTTQQTAAADIPIKMYTYDNAGGQVLIIENGGE